MTSRRSLKNWKQISDKRLWVLIPRYPEAFEELFTRHHDGVFRRCYSILSNCQNAEDAAADTFYKLRIERVKGTRIRASFAALTYTIARNTCLKMMKRGEKMKVGLPANVEDPVLPGTSAREECLRECIDDLPAAEAQVILQHYFEKRTFKSIGKDRHKSSAQMSRWHKSILNKLGLCLRRKGV